MWFLIVHVANDKVQILLYGLGSQGEEVQIIYEYVFAQGLDGGSVVGQHVLKDLVDKVYYCWLYVFGLDDGVETLKRLFHTI